MEIGNWHGWKGAEAGDLGGPPGGVPLGEDEVELPSSPLQVVQHARNQRGGGKHPGELLLLIPRTTEGVDEQVAVCQRFGCVEADEPIDLSRLSGGKQVSGRFAHLAPELLCEGGAQVPLWQDEARPAECVWLQIVSAWQMISHDVHFS